MIEKLPTEEGARAQRLKEVNEAGNEILDTIKARFQPTSDGILDICITLVNVMGNVVISAVDKAYVDEAEKIISGLIKESFVNIRAHHSSKESKE